MSSDYRNLIFAVLVFIFVLFLSYLGCFNWGGNVSPEVFTQQALAGVLDQTSKHKTDWRLGEEIGFVESQDTGRLTFMFADGTRVSAPMQIIGTYNIADGTFRWGWDHPIVREPYRKHAELALKFGQDHQLPKYTQSIVPCTKEEAWAFTATAAKLGNANGAYVSTAGNTLLFMTFGEVSVNDPLSESSLSDRSLTQ